MAWIRRWRFGFASMRPPPLIARRPMVIAVVHLKPVTGRVLTAPHGCATAPPRLTSQAPRPTPVLPCSLRSRFQIASDRSRNVRVRTDNEPDNDHTNTPRTTQIGRLFLLSFAAARIRGAEQ